MFPQQILVVEADDIQRLLLTELLEEEGYHVLGAQDAADALSILRSHEVELILMDLSLPDMNGFILFEIIHAQRNLMHIPVIFLTGNAEELDKSQIFDAGVVDIIVKPFDGRDLLGRLQVHIRMASEMQVRREQAKNEAETARRVLLTAQQRFNTLVENTLELVCELYESFRIAYASPNHREILQYDPESLIGLDWLDLVHPENRETTRDALSDIIKRPVRKHLRIQFKNAAGDWRWLEISGSEIGSGSDTRLLLVMGDITSVQIKKEELQRLALHDALTGLGNRQKFFEELAATPVTTPPSSAVVYFDIDNFKLINDTKGHSAGDTALTFMAQALKSSLNSRHMTYRLGGDEFCVLLRDLDKEQALAEAWRLVSILGDWPIVFAGNWFSVNISAGLAMIEEGINHQEIVSRASSALRAAKAEGKNRVLIYHTGSEEIRNIRNSAEWGARIQRGLQEKRFKISYQPIVCAADLNIFCHEALLRYEGEDGAVHSPSEFMPGAERYSMMQEVDRYVIRHVLADMAARPGLRASINLSGNSISDPGMHDFIVGAFKQSGVEPARVIFEITETIFISNLAAARRIVEQLQSIGCQFALDDFGAGFSSLLYLKNLPVNIVKIAGNFLDEIESDPVDRALVRTINEIAHLLGKRTVAEYVSSASVWQLLREMGVDYGQGYHLGKPALTE